MKDKRKYVPVFILAGFLLTAIVLWVGRSIPDGSVGHTDVPRITRSTPDLRDQGLIVRFSQSQFQQSDSRISRLLALYVQPDEPPTPFLDPGPFQAIWEGWIEIPEEDEYAFQFQGSGHVEMMIGGAKVLAGSQSDSEQIHLAEGTYNLNVRYFSPESEPARMRLLWSASSFAAEPIPPMILSHDASDGGLQKATLLRQGRMLIAEHSCLSCHQPEDPSFLDELTAMPELSMDAPDLQSVGSRLRSGWMQKWVKEPRSVRPSAKMPSFNLTDEQAVDIAVYLATLGEAPSPPSPAPTSARIVEGGQLFAKQGCGGCHSLDPDTDDERLNLTGVSDKWYPSALTEYLREPAKHNKWTGMPDYRLEEEEAAAITAFLLDKSEPAKEKQPLDGNTERGRILIQQHGCGSCHALPAENRFTAPSLEALMQTDWDQGCMAGHLQNDEHVPYYPFTTDEKLALQTFANEGFKSLNRLSPIEFASRQIQTLNCRACHQIDGWGDRLSDYSHEVDYLIEGAETNPYGERRPALTWTGEQLQPEWLKNTLAGTLEQPARPWLDSRMPGIGAKPSLLAKGMMAAHGYGTDYEDIQPDDYLAGRGRALAVGIGYLGCNSCHHGGEAGGMAAPHLDLLGDRLRPEFFHWMIKSPRRVDPQTAMPEYINDEGMTWQREIFEGDAQQQFEAIWHYLVDIKDKTDDDIDAGSSGTPYAEMYQQMEKGPVYSGVISVPDEGVRPKGLSIRVGDKQQAAMHFDHDLLLMSAAWTGEFLEFNSNADWGIRSTPFVAGRIRFTNPEVTGWTNQNMPLFTDTRDQSFGPIPEEQGRYKGFYQHGNRAVISFSIHGTDVYESPWYVENDQTGAFVRDLKIGVHDQSLSVLLFITEGEAEIENRGSLQIIRTEQNGRVKAAVVREEKSIRFIDSNGQAAIRFEPRASEQSYRVLLWEGDVGQEEAFLSLAAEAATPDDLDRLIEPGPKLWETLVTRGETGESDGPYAVDVISSPLENPYDALFHFSGVDFMPDGRAVLSTIHGDVWFVDGLDESLEQVIWQRYATGLNMPFGVRVVDNKIYVSNQDELTILHDRNGDGEADYYENFRNLISPGRGAWRQAFGLEVDEEGNFYFTRGRGHREMDEPNGVFRISPDGKEIERIAIGFRQPWTMGISPEDNVTVTQQEGPWVPQTPIHMIDLETRKGGFYGNLETQLSESEMQEYQIDSYPRELGFEPPILWLPRHIDSSAGGQVWVDSDVWGLPRDQMLHMSWARGTLMQLMYEQIDGDRQGGVVPLARFDDLRPRTGRFRQQDGQLYVAGFENKGFQRVRYTGERVNLPVAIHAHENGMRLRFSDPLNPTHANDVANYTLHRWNYIWQDYYGSHHYSVRNPGQFGEDLVEVGSVTLLDNGHEIFLEIPDMLPVMQMRITYDLEAADGTPLQEAIYNTVHILGPAFSPSSDQALR